MWIKQQIKRSNLCLKSQLSHDWVNWRWKDLNPDKIQADKTCTTELTVCLQSSTPRHLLQSIYWCFVIGSKWFRLETAAQQTFLLLLFLQFISAQKEITRQDGLEKSWVARKSCFWIQMTLCTCQRHCQGQDLFFQKAISSWIVLEQDAKQPSCSLIINSVYDTIFCLMENVTNIIITSNTVVDDILQLCPNCNYLQFLFGLLPLSVCPLDPTEIQCSAGWILAVMMSNRKLIM